MGGTGLVGGSATDKRRLTIAVSVLAFEALMAGESNADVSLRVENALSCYLGDRGGERPAWAYPAFLRGSETRRDVELELSVREDLWRDFEEEATRQGVTVEQLAEHAAFYFGAEVDAGRVTQRILEDLDSGAGGELD